MEAGVRIFFSRCRSIYQITDQLAASRTIVAIQPSLRLYPLNRRRLISHESINAEERTLGKSKAYFSQPREEVEDHSFPSAKSPLRDETWRQFLTSDQKIIVCVHPEKAVQLEDTKPLRPIKRRVQQQRSELGDDEIQIVRKLRNEDGSLWTVNTLARFFNVKRAIISKVAPANLERQAQLQDEKALMSKLRPYKRRLLQTQRQMERQKRLEAVIAQNKKLSSIRDKYRLQP